MKAGKGQAFALHLPTSNDAHAARCGSTSINPPRQPITESRLVPPRQAQSRLQATEGSPPAARAQEASRSIQSPAEMPFSRQGILEGSTRLCSQVTRKSASVSRVSSLCVNQPPTLKTSIPTEAPPKGPGCLPPPIYKCKATWPQKLLREIRLTNNKTQGTGGGRREIEV